MKHHFREPRTREGGARLFERQSREERTRGRADKSAAETRWRNTWCIDGTATEDLRQYGGTELDWTQFFWALTAPGITVGTGPAWTMTEALKPYQEICGREGMIGEGAVCRVEMTWDVLFESIGRLQISGDFSPTQQVRFDEIGDTRGVRPL